ncbi:DoxX family protein [Streptomyces albus]|uniref:DoxX family protein n=1 Tax=Streptomyces albus TaxID=1888 RepID=UPI00099D5A63|nr:DoxX family protein [Streptomyces albus]
MSETRAQQDGTIQGGGVQGGTAGTVAGPGAAAGGARKGRAMAITVLVLRIVFGLFFAIASALPKLIAHSSATESFDKIGLGDWFMYLTGVLELAGGIALLIPLLSGLAAFSLVALLICAFGITMTVFDGENAASPLLFAIPIAVIAWYQRHTVPELFARLRSALGR